MALYFINLDFGLHKIWKMFGLIGFVTIYFAMFAQFSERNSISVEVISMNLILEIQFTEDS